MRMQSNAPRPTPRPATPPAVQEIFDALLEMVAAGGFVAVAVMRRPITMPQRPQDAPCDLPRDRCPAHLRPNPSPAPTARNSRTGAPPAHTQAARAKRPRHAPNRFRSTRVTWRVPGTRWPAQRVTPDLWRLAG
jgi:hypothetical protein